MIHATPHPLIAPPAPPVNRFPRAIRPDKFYHHRHNIDAASRLANLELERIKMARLQAEAYLGPLPLRLIDLNDGHFRRYGRGPTYRTPPVRKQLYRASADPSSGVTKKNGRRWTMESVWWAGRKPREAELRKPKRLNANLRDGDDSEWDIDLDYGSADELVASNALHNACSEASPEQPAPPVNYHATDIPPGKFYHDPQDVDTTARLEANLEAECIEILTDFYGFVMPIPDPCSPNLTAPPSPAHQTYFLRAIGIGRNHVTAFFFATKVFGVAREFVKGLVKNEARSPLCDLEESNRRSLAMSSRIRFISTVKLPGSEGFTDRVLYVFNMKDRASVPWMLAVTCAADALTICRLDEGLRERDIADYLVNNGIPFHTLTRGRWQDRSIPAIVSHQPQYSNLPTRHQNHVFGKPDYDEYVHVRAVILSQPHARAALLRGGIVWRLAVSTLSLPSVASGSVGGGSTMTAGDQEQGFWYDDGLTALELDLICGAYSCYTDGSGGKTTIKSWWPQVTSCDGIQYGEHYGRWTDLREQEYSSRLREIEAGRAELYNATTSWREKWKDFSPVRQHMNMANETRSRTFLKDLIPTLVF